MTREEAIRLLSGLIFKGKLKEALDMAIKALEQEPRKITLEDVKGYCKPRYLTIIPNELLYELTHPKIKTLEQEPCEDCYAVPSNEMILERARQASKDLRKRFREDLEQEPKTGE